MKSDAGGCARRSGNAEGAKKRRVRRGFRVGARVKNTLLK
jgi:hypothetical protein